MKLKSIADLNRICYNDNIVYQCLQAGGDFEDCCVILSDELRRLEREIVRLSLIAPKRVKLADGRVMVWRCPDELVPDGVR